MLSVMEPLLSYGFYRVDSEINEIIGFLTDIVNGMHDQPYPSKDYINNISLFSLSLSLFLKVLILIRLININKRNVSKQQKGIKRSFKSKTG